MIFKITIKIHLLAKGTSLKNIILQVQNFLKFDLPSKLQLDKTKTILVSTDKTWMSMIIRTGKIYEN